jgi:hypothetical protein
MKAVLGAAFVITVGVCVGIGCAKSEEDEPLFGIGHTDPADAGDEGGKKKKVVVGDDDDDKPAPKGDDDDDNTSSSSSSSSGGSSSSSSSSGGSSSSSSSSSGSTAPDPCKVTTCNTAKMQTSISGDTSSSARTITGAVSQWFTIDVTENNTGIFSSGQNLRLKATLTSPPGKNFDLFVYVPTSGGVKECHLNDESSEEAAGTEDVVSVSWGEGDGGDPNGMSDTRTVSIEVREIVDAAAPPATCDPTAKWTLKLEGNK